jgi:hypothetical protein
MMTFKIHKIHKYTGIMSGILLLLLTISGFFLNHDNWKFLYTTTVPNSYLPAQTIKQNIRLYNTYHIDSQYNNIHILAGFRGIYRSNDFGKNYGHVFDIPVYDLVAINNKDYYAATSQGVYLSQDKARTWQLFALPDEAITSLSFDDEKLLISIEKSELVLLDKQGEILSRTSVSILPSELQHDISMGRLVRDIHYGRGIFDDGLSLLLNDFSTLWLTLLALSGYILWYLIKNIRHNKSYKKPLSFLLKIHASSWVLIAVIPLILLAVTGIFLDHSQFFGKFLRQTKISHTILPPIYNSLKEDIWSIDIHDGVYRIGNRYGIYKSTDMKQWKLESKGFAYKMMRENSQLFVSGMGAPNRIYNNKQWSLLNNKPHMFKSINTVENKRSYFSTHHTDISFPKVTDTSLYTILLSIHDGSFFASWWVFVNDIASILLLLLLYTGLRLWYRRVKK